MKSFLLLTAITLATFFSIEAQEIIKIEDHIGAKPVVRMTLNGKKIWVLLDTGASVNLLDINAQRKYDFGVYNRPNNTVNVVGFASSEIELPRVDGIDLRYQGVRLQDEFLAHDLTDVINSVKQESMITISGIIGYSMMRKYGFVIDMGKDVAVLSYKRRKMRKPKCSDSNCN